MYKGRGFWHEKSPMAQEEPFGMQNKKRGWFIKNENVYKNRPQKPAIKVVGVIERPAVVSNKI